MQYSVPTKVEVTRASSSRDVQDECQKRSASNWAIDAIGNPE